MPAAEPFRYFSGIVHNGKGEIVVCHSMGALNGHRKQSLVYHGSNVNKKHCAITSTVGNKHCRQ